MVHRVILEVHFEHLLNSLDSSSKEFELSNACIFRIQLIVHWGNFEVASSCLTTPPHYYQGLLEFHISNLHDDSSGKFHISNGTYFESVQQFIAPLIEVVILVSFKIVQ